MYRRPSLPKTCKVPAGLCREFHARHCRLQTVVFPQGLTDIFVADFDSCSGSYSLVVFQFEVPLTRSSVGLVVDGRTYNFPAACKSLEKDLEGWYASAYDDYEQLGAIEDCENKGSICNLVSFWIIV